MLEREGAFYAAHKAEFHEKYNDKWLVIVGETLWGVYSTVAEATQKALEHFKPGEFMLHKPARDGIVIEVGPYFDTQSHGDVENLEQGMTFSEGDLATFPYAH